MQKTLAAYGALFLAATVGPMGPTLSAQMLVPVAHGHSAPRDTSIDNDSRVAFRLFTATVGGAAGAWMVGRIGYEIGQRCRPSCHDMDGFFETWLGVLAGGTIGSAIGAALPRGRGLCHRGERFARTLGGASLGLVAGIGLMMVPPLVHGFIVTIPVGSVLFMRKC